MVLVFGYLAAKSSVYLDHHAAQQIILQVANATEDPLAWLINLGVAGIVIVLFVTGKLRSEKEVLYLLEQIEAKDQLISAFQAQLTGHTLPALAQSAQVIEQIPRRRNDLIDEVQQAKEDLAELTRAIREMTREQK